MKKLVLHQLVAMSALVATYLISAPVAFAQEPLSALPFYKIEGLRFETPYPLTSTNSSDSADLNFLTSLKFGTYQPILINEKSSSTDISEIVLPPTLATVILPASPEPITEEATESAVLEKDTLDIGLTFNEEATDSAEIINTIKKTAMIPVAPVTAMPTAKPTVKPTAKPTIKPTAKPTVQPTSTPTEKPAESEEVKAPTQLSNGGLNADMLFEMSNNYRRDHGLEPFVKDDRACSLAASRAPEIGAEIAEGHMHSGLRARNLPYWNGENIISMRSEQAAFNWWINDKIHHDQIVGAYKYSCVACDGNNCAQEFTNFVYKR